MEDQHARVNRARINALAKSALRAAKFAASAAIGAKLPGNKPKRKFNIVKRKSSLFQTIKPNAFGSSTSYFTSGRKKMSKQNKLITKTLSPTHYVYNLGTRIQNTVGLQEYFTIGTYFDQTFNDIIIGQIVSSPLEDDETIKNKKVFFERVRAEITLQSMSNGTLRATIYDITARRDIPSATIANPLNTIQTSMSEVPTPSNTAGADANYKVQGLSPFHSPIFCQFFKIRKVTNIELTQGQTHVHRVNYRPYKWVSNSVLSNLDYGVKGLTSYSVICLNGVPSNDSVTKTSATVTTGLRTLDVIQNYVMDYRYANENFTRLLVTDNLPKSFAVSEQLMNIGTGEGDIGENP